MEFCHKGNFLWKFPTKFLWQFFNKTEYFFREFFHENSATLGGNFVTKQREFWWKFPQNPPNCLNFHAATLPCCKGFCDSAWAPSPQSSTQCQLTLPCCTVCLVWLALGNREIPYGGGEVRRILSESYTLLLIRKLDSIQVRTFVSKRWSFSFLEMNRVLCVGILFKSGSDI